MTASAAGQQCVLRLYGQEGVYWPPRLCFSMLVYNYDDVVVTLQPSLSRINFQIGLDVNRR